VTKNDSIKSGTDDRCKKIENEFLFIIFAINYTKKQSPDMASLHSKNLLIIFISRF
jgi:hypothetical protein